jgi:hypothetical protein
MSRFTIEGVKCENCGTMLHMGSEKMPPVPVEISFGTKADSARYPTDYMDSPNAEVHTLDRCRWQQAENKAHALHAELEQAKERLRTHEGWCELLACSDPNYNLPLGIGRDEAIFIEGDAAAILKMLERWKLLIEADAEMLVKEGQLEPGWRDFEAHWSKFKKSKADG